MSLMYLEDYLELVSFLPQEFRERLTKVRELDLEASNRRDNIEKLKKQLRKPPRIIKSENINIPGPLPTPDALSPNDRIRTIQEINSEYDKIVELGVEKIRIVSGLEEMMIRYNRRLATDTEKFKLELEADSPGITESLEARAEAEMKNFYDGGPKVVSAEAPRVPSSRRIADMGAIVAMQRKQALLHGQAGVVPRQTTSSIDGKASSRRVNNLLTPSGGTGMLARAASQAIAATQQMPHGRRTASLKASYEAAVRNTPTNSSRGGSPERDDISTKGDGRRRGPRAAARKVEVETETEDVGTDTADDDNTLYCFCKHPSFGFMVACDNPGCQIEWFHGSCVGVTSEEVEKKKWYCPTCTETMKKEKKHKLVKSETGGRPDHGANQKYDGSSKFSKKQHRKPQ